MRLMQLIYWDGGSTGSTLTGYLQCPVRLGGLKLSSWSTPGSKFIFFVHYGRDPNDARLDSCRGRFGGSAAPSACQCFDTHIVSNGATEKPSESAEQDHTGCCNNDDRLWRSGTAEMHKGLAPVGESIDASICRSWGRAAGADNSIVGSSIFEHP